MEKIDLETAVPIGLIIMAVGAATKFFTWLFNLNKDVQIHTKQLADIEKALTERQVQLDEIKDGQVTILERMMRVETLLSTIYDSLNRRKK